MSIADLERNSSVSSNSSSVCDATLDKPSRGFNHQKSIRTIGLVVWGVSIALPFAIMASEAPEDAIKLTAQRNTAAMYTASCWSDGKIPHNDAIYVSDGNGLQTTSKERAAAPDDSSYRKNQFRGQKMVLTGSYSILDGGTQEAPVEFLNDGVVIEGGYWRSWTAGENWIKGQIKLAMANFRFDAPTAGQNMTFRLTGKFLSSATSSAWVRYQENLWKNADGTIKEKTPGVPYYSGLVTLDLRDADCSEFYGKLATESGGVIRVGTSLPNAKLVLGELFKNAPTFPELWPLDQAFNGSLQVTPSDSNMSGEVAVGTVEENGGSVVLAASAKLTCANLTLNGGAIEVGTAADGVSVGSIEVMDSFVLANGPVKVVLDGVLNQSGTVLTVAKSAGTLRLEDFQLAFSDACRNLMEAYGVKLTVEDAGSCWKLNFDMMPVVTKLADDNNQTKVSFMNNAENWSDKQYPHSGVTYYTTKSLYPLRDDYILGDGVSCVGGRFLGQRLVMDGSMMLCERIANERGYDFPDDGLVIADGHMSRIRFWGRACLSGQMTVFNTKPDGFKMDWAINENTSLAIGMKMVSPVNAYLDLTFQGDLFGKPDTSTDGLKFYDRIITVSLEGDVSEWRGTIGVETNHILITKNGLPNGKVAMGLTGYPYAALGAFENGNNGTLSVTNEGVVAFGGLSLNGGRLELADKTVCTVGDLSLKQGVIQCAATEESVGRIVATKTVTVEASPVKIRLSAQPCTSVDLLTAPKESTFTASDFSVLDLAGNPLPAMKSIVEDGETRVLRLTFIRNGLILIFR